MTYGITLYINGEEEGDYPSVGAVDCRLNELAKEYPDIDCNIQTQNRNIHVEIKDYKKPVYDESIESNLDKMETRFLITLALRLLPEHCATEIQKLIVVIDLTETNQNVRNSKIRILCKKIIRKEMAHK